MFSYKVLRKATSLMVFSVGYYIGGFLVKRFGNDTDKKIFKYARVFLLVMSAIMFIWLLFNKELFHWNYDIATGEPVDHYSTYGKCIVYTIIALVSNIIAGIACFKKKNVRKKQRDLC